MRLLPNRINPASFSARSHRDYRNFFKFRLCLHTPSQLPHSPTPANSLTAPIASPEIFKTSKTKLRYLSSALLLLSLPFQTSSAIVTVRFFLKSYLPFVFYSSASTRLH